MSILRVFISALAVIVATLECGSAALAQTNHELVQGKEIAIRLCAGCHHANARDLVVIEGVVVPSFNQIANVPHMSRERLEALLIIPHRPMSSVPLPVQDVRALASYILSLK